jgi:uncharacterized pyridoxal phosphate-containing UPF0001 family protein
VTLIAVTRRMGGGDRAAPGARAHRDFGENRVQEAQAKWPMLRERYSEVRLHLIGQLQSNKAAEAVALFDVIHSVDRASLVTALAKAAEAAGRRPECFIQVISPRSPRRGAAPCRTCRT